MAQLISTALTLQKIHFYNILDHVNEFAPMEACGLVAGINGGSQIVFPITNLLHSPTRFEMHPQEQVAAMLSIQESDWQLLAIYHSHPAGPPSPSSADLTQDTYPRTIHLILSCQTGAWEYQAYRYNNARFQIIPVIVGQ